MQHNIHFLNGTFVTEKELLISPRDLGYTRGFAVFDFLITYNHKPFKLDDHIKRLFLSAEEIDLDVPWSKAQVKKWVLSTLKKNDNKKEYAIKIILSGGISTTLIPAAKPTIMIFVDTNNPFPRALYSSGAHVITHKYMRLLPKAKSNHYIEVIKQMQKHKNLQPLEVIYYDDAQVFEGATSNVFMVTNNIIYTPKTNILSGITRETVIKDLHLKNISIKDFTIDDLLKADEIFLTSSNKEIMPVTKVDNTIIGNGKVGPVTQSVMQSFKSLFK